MLPFFLAEHRKRLLLGAYSIDKELATFLGRPPRISWRHIDVDPPLDITYDELISEPEIRDAAISQLDDNGWNKTGKVSTTSFARAIFLMGRIRERVLELSFNSLIDDLEGEITKISNLSRETRSKLPAHFRQVSWVDVTTGPVSETKLMSLCIHMDSLYNELIMQRILVKRTGHESNTLTVIAHEMLNTVLVTISRLRDANKRYNVAWNVWFCLFAHLY